MTIDHHWGSVKEKTPANMLVHRLLHLSHPVHRSWQTHSVLVTGGFCFLCYSVLKVCDSSHILNALELVILRLWLVGFAIGILSHLILDSITTAGVYLTPGFKFRLVPKSSLFATGGNWELGIQKLLYLAIIIDVGYLISLFGG